MSIQASDPLALLAYQDALVGTPLREGAAEGSSALDTQQRAAVIGEVIPVVFGRRVGDTGGVLISPPATEARFEDAANGDVTASYHLVLSEGRIDSIQVRDVFQRSCRVGSFTQTYDRRAGTFVPGNFIDDSPNLEAPYYCGTGGSYAGLSTLAFSVTIPAGFDYWNRQVHCFARGGMWVPRLLDSVTGPSNNVVDLLLYLLQNSSKISAAQIDTTSLLAAARFTDTNGLWFNGLESSSKNVRDWMADVLPYFLLRESRVGGKEGLRPLLPSTASGAIATSAVSWEFTFTEEHVQPGGFDIRYTPLSDRKPFCVLVLWRQQPTDDIGLIRSTEVRYSGTAEDGPFEQHDLSRFCASENHAVKVGAYILSRRRHITHTLALKVKPDSFNPTLAPGALVRVKLDRIASTGAASVHDYLYEVDRIGKSITGEVLLALTHFPVDEQLRSVVAQEVAAAQGSGILLPTSKTGVSCDLNSSTDISVPADTGSNYIPAYSGAFDYTIYAFNPIQSLNGRKTANSKDALSRPIATPTLSLSNPIPRVGDMATAPTICTGGIVKWYRLNPSAPGGKSYLTQGPTYTMVINDVNYSVYAEIECPDASSPTGYGPPTATNPVGPIYPAPSLPDANVYGTYSPTGVNTITIDYKYKGNFWYAGAACTPTTYIGSQATFTVNAGIKGWRVVRINTTIVATPGNGPGPCGGYFGIALEYQIGNGTWLNGGAISGGSTDWQSFSGSISMSSTAPDAIPAYLGNFGGTSNPP